jgi:hypothetical protein
MVTGYLSIQQLQVPLTYTFTRPLMVSVPVCYNEYCGDYTDHSNIIYSTRVRSVKIVLHHYCLVLLIIILSGTWSPPATINTATAGTNYLYSLLRLSVSGRSCYNEYCCVTTQITPTFTQLGPLCQNSYCTITAWYFNNNITGTWSPATI